MRATLHGMQNCTHCLTVLGDYGGSEPLCSLPPFLRRCFEKLYIS